MGHLATKANAWIYAKSGGRIGASFGGHPVLLLTTVGRRSGEPRRTPVQYTSINGSTYLVAAGGGSPKPPLWFRNIEANPAVTVQIGAGKFEAEAVVLGASERAPVWEALVANNSQLERAQTKAGRELPVVRIDH